MEWLLKPSLHEPPLALQQSPHYKDLKYWNAYHALKLSLKKEVSSSPTSKSHRYQVRQNEFIQNSHLIDYDKIKASMINKWKRQRIKLNEAFVNDRLYNSTVDVNTELKFRMAKLKQAQK